MSLDNIDDALLTATRQLGSLAEDLAELAAGSEGAARLGLSENFFDAHAENLRHGNEVFGLGDAAGGLPLEYRRVVNAQLPRQLAHAETGVLAQQEVHARTYPHGKA